MPRPLWTTFTPGHRGRAACRDVGTPPRRAVLTLVADPADRRRAGRGPPRRGRRPPGRRAPGLPRPGGRGHRDRGGADRDVDDHRRQGHLRPRARHRLRGRDDQRSTASSGCRCWSARSSTTSRCSTPRAPARCWPPSSPSPRSASCCRPFTTSEPGPDLHRPAARLRRDRVPGALRHVRLHPDDPAPRLLPAGRSRRREHRGRPSTWTSTTTATPTRRTTGPPPGAPDCWSCP